MQINHVTFSLIFFNLIFAAFLLWIVHTIAIDCWFLAKSGPNFCAEETVDGKTIFVFCDEVEVE